MINWKELQKKVIAQYPDFKTLPFWTRLKIRMSQHPSVRNDIFNEGLDRYSQTYRTYFHEGKIYFYKLGGK